MASNPTPSTHFHLHIFCAHDVLFMQALQWTLIPHTKPGLHWPVESGGGGGCIIKTDRWTDSQTAGHMNMLCYIFRYSFISLPLQKWYTLLEQALAT